MYKIYVSYDMQAGKEEDCQRYFAQVLGPTLVRFGANVADARTRFGVNLPKSRAAACLTPRKKCNVCWLPKSGGRPWPAWTPW